MWVYVCGFTLHIIFLAAMFDIYFKTPIVPGISSLPNPVPGSAKRLVFIVADGLRADSFFLNSETMPYLRYKIENQASWGVSHTRLPTESRPGVVALVAGIYEDPSAVFKGWKKNPAEFDTVFNQSRRTWAWGSPDVVLMFSQDNVETMVYGEHEEEFFGESSSSMLDVWVFNHVKMLFENAKTNSSLNKYLHEDRLVFFLHLLGLDTAGHSVKPLSLKYQENLRVVDEGIKSMEDLFENFYDDGKTAYVFTADHGMTDWGSHGAGSDHETEVPLLAWGPGIEGPRHPDPWDPPSPINWHLQHLKRKDVKQADTVTLLSSLIGCNIPVNSVGRLPKSYLALPEEQVAQLSLYNGRQLSAQALRKQELVQSRSFSWLFTPFWRLPSKDPSFLINSIQHSIELKMYSDAIQLAEELGETSIHALRYYHNYHQSLLLISTSLSFLGWIVWLLCQLYQHKPGNSHVRREKKSHLTDVLFFMLGIIVFLLIQVQGLDFQFNIYCILPILLWRSVLNNLDSCKPILNSSQGYLKPLAAVVVLVIFVEIMVFSFFQRWALMIGVLICGGWPLFTDKMVRVPFSVAVMWFSSCFCVFFFPILPVIGSETRVIYVVLSAVSWIFMAGLVQYFLIKRNIWYDKILLCQFFLTLLTILVVSWVTIYIDLGHGLPISIQLFSWIILFISPMLSTLGEKSVPIRLMRVCLALLPPYVLLSVRHEAFILLGLCLNLMSWFLMETQMSDVSFHEIRRKCFPVPVLMEKSDIQLSSNDVRRAAFFVFYIFLSFFGTGNIASLNSFEITWVRCFISVFSPFTMMILILFKMIVPFVIVCSFFRAINITIKAPTNHMFTIVLILCDMMGLQFLHYVTNEGSWLDIGISISHYVIVQVTVLALVLLYGLSSVLTGASISHFANQLKFNCKESPINPKNKNLNESSIKPLHGFKRKPVLPYFHLLF